MPSPGPTAYPLTASLLPMWSFLSECEELAGMLLGFSAAILLAHSRSKCVRRPSSHPRTLSLPSSTPLTSSVTSSPQGWAHAKAFSDLIEVCPPRWMGTFPDLSVFLRCCWGSWNLSRSRTALCGEGGWAVCCGRPGQRRDSRDKVGFPGGVALSTLSGARVGKASMELELGGSSDSHHSCHL